jgi:hypothetical protein|tara:strand:+ start:955 stop:1221 length:267 start_codon:yes stop_codon:yes gene_type:complete
MKIFIYKSLFVFFLILILFKLTIGALVNNYQEKLEEVFSKEYINKVKIKIREEVKIGIEKERILSSDDALLINKFINKLQKEISDVDK